MAVLRFKSHNQPWFHHRQIPLVSLVLVVIVTLLLLTPKTGLRFSANQPPTCTNNPVSFQSSNEKLSARDFLPNSVDDSTSANFNSDVNNPLTLSRNGTGGLDSLFREESRLDYSNACGPVDVLILLDVSGSMNQHFIGDLNHTKFEVAQSAIFTMLNELAGRNGGKGDGSRVNLITFGGHPPDHQYDFGYADIQERFPQQAGDYFIPVSSGNVANLIQTVNNVPKPVNGNTSLAQGILAADQSFSNRLADTKLPPMLILLSDGVPSLDLTYMPIPPSPLPVPGDPYYRWYDQTKVNSISQTAMYDPIYLNNQFRSITAVRKLGGNSSNPQWTDPDSSIAQYGEPLADTMVAVDRLKADHPDIKPAIRAVALQPAPNEDQLFRDDILRYIATADGSVASGIANTYEPNTTDSLAQDIKVVIDSLPGSLTVDLPPASILTPRDLTFDDAAFRSFNPANLAFTNSVNPSNYIVGMRFNHINADGSPNIGDFYSLGISNIIGRPNTRSFKLSFVPTVSGATVGQLISYLQTKGNLPGAVLTDSSCQSVAQSFVCFKTSLAFQAQGLAASLPNTLHQLISLPGLTIQGNVGANTILKNFSISSKALAVGGTITSVTGGQNLAGYITNSSQLSWNNSLKDKLTAIYNRKNLAQSTRGSDIGVGAAAFPGNRAGKTWYLNSSNPTNPTDSQTDTFSNPPEGKLWNITGGAFTLGNGIDPITFSGRGTLVFDGDVTISSPISCGSNTQLGIITSGSIKFNTTSVACGAFVALGINGGAGNIGLSQPSGCLPSGTCSLTSILVAGNDIQLPDPTKLNGVYAIKFDSRFAENPTVLFQEILKLVLTTTG